MNDETGKTVIPNSETGPNLNSRMLGRYRILEKAGEGGMAVVHKAEDTRLGNLVAIKFIRTDRLAPELAAKSLKRFEREAKSLAQLSHPNIVKVLDYGDMDGQPYIVMEYLPGGTLKQRLPGKIIAWEQAIKALLPIAQALQFAHERNIIHRDVKPSNVLFNEAKQPVLSDFGIVKMLGDDATQDLSTTSLLVGTPEYMSPEQARGEPFDHRVDIYALGIMLYEMVTGRKPFKADTPVGMLVKQASEPLPRPTLFNPDLPAAVEAALMKTLAKNPDERFRSMEGLISSLSQLLASSGKSAGQGLMVSETEKSSTRIPVPTPAPVRPARQPSMASWAPWLAFGGIGLVSLCLLGLVGLGLLGLFPGQGTAAAAAPPEASAPQSTVVSNPIPATNTIPAALVTLPEITNTLAATRTTAPTFTAAPTAARVSTTSCQLQLCASSSNADVCVYSIAPQSNNLIVALKFKQALSAASLPKVTIADKSFKCEIISSYPDRLYCSGSSATGENIFQVFSPNNQLICAGRLNIPKYVAPSPTPKKPGNSYP